MTNQRQARETGKRFLQKGYARRQKTNCSAVLPELRQLLCGQNYTRFSVKPQGAIRGGEKTAQK